MSSVTLLLSALCLLSRGSIASEDKDAWPSLEERAAALLDEYPVIDGHNDFPLTVLQEFGNDMNRFDFNSNLSLTKELKNYSFDHTDLLRLKKGKVGAQFWSAYMDCNSQFKDAVQLYIGQIDLIKRFVAKYPEDLTFVTTAGGIQKAFKDKKIASLIGIESGHAIGSDLGVLRMMYELGGRYMTLTHSCNTPWAGSSVSEDEPEAKEGGVGLSKFGESVILEMNRLGMMVDLAHVSANTMRDALNITKAPVIFSHSNSRAILNHTRNVPDDVLLSLRDNGGIIMLNFFNCYVTMCDENYKGVAKLEDMVRHINHIRNITGSVNHIGIGGDYNGVPSLVNGLEDSSKYPTLFVALLKDKEYEWTEEELAKIASNNLLRVFFEVEEISKSLSHTEPSLPVKIPKDKLNIDQQQCIAEEIEIM